MSLSPHHHHHALNEKTYQIKHETYKKKSFPCVTSLVVMHITT